MKLSIITVNYNHKHFPKLSLEALERSKTDFDFEIIFVDNASSDPISLGFLAQASREGRIKFIRSEKNLGFAGGNNLGVRGGATGSDGARGESGAGEGDGAGVGGARGESGAGEGDGAGVGGARGESGAGEGDGAGVGGARGESGAGELDYARDTGGINVGGGARGEYLLFLNPDTAVFDDSLQKMVDFMESHPEAGILGPKLVYADGTVQESCRRDMRFLDLVVKRTPLRKIPWGRTRLEKYLMGDFDHDKIQSVELITGAAMMMRREIFEKVGGFDERYFLFMEDFDLCKKVRTLKTEASTLNSADQPRNYQIVYFPEAQINHYHKRLSDGNALALLGKKVFWMHLSSAAKYFWKWGSRV